MVIHVIESNLNIFKEGDLMGISYVRGDATLPMGDGNKIIVHVCNDVGGWGRGFVVAISRRWREPEMKYREWHKNGDGFELGEIQLVQVSGDIWVCNLIGQRNIYGKGGRGGYIPPVRYDAIESGLMKLSKMAQDLSASVHMPRIGCGLAGGRWEDIDPIIQRTLLKDGIDTIVYDFGKKVDVRKFVGRAKAQKRHVQRRAIERFGIAISDGEYIALLNEFRSGRLIALGRQSNRVSFHLAKIDNNYIVCVYDSKTKAMASFLRAKWNKRALGLIKDKDERIFGLRDVAHL